MIVEKMGNFDVAEKMGFEVERMENEIRRENGVQ